MKYFILFISIHLSVCCFSQSTWQNVDSLYGPLPLSFHVYYTNQPIDTAPFKAYYVVVDLKDKKLEFETDTTLNRRLTPAQFYKKNNQPLLVVNGTFFSFETNRNLNAVVKSGKLVSFNSQAVIGKGKDTFTYKHPFASAIGINKKREADIAWLLTDSVKKKVYATQSAIQPIKDSSEVHDVSYFLKNKSIVPGGSGTPSFSKWKMQTAIGGGPVLIQKGQIQISNNEEMKFGGKAINDKHPRTAMGYTRDQKLIILVIEGRNKVAHGATLVQEAQILKDLGCEEALNLDGGGSSCLLINGKETIKPADPAGQRPVPAIFFIREK